MKKKKGRFQKLINIWPVKLIINHWFHRAVLSRLILTVSKNADLYVNLITLTRYHRREIRFWETSQCVLLCDQCHPSLVLLSPQRLACHLPQWLLAVKVKRKSTYNKETSYHLKNTCTGISHTKMILIL